MALSINRDCDKDTIGHEETIVALLAKKYAQYTNIDTI